MKKYIVVLSLGFLAGFGSFYLYLNSNNNLLPVAFSPDGGQYYGTLVSGVYEGKGKIVWDNNDYYEGSFRKGLYHGQGKMVVKNSIVYEGEFTEGKITGFGTMSYHEGDIYTGFFKDGRQEGEGKYQYQNTLYEGTFINNKLHGKGRFLDEFNNLYVGEFVDGMFSGDGVYTTSDGQIYDGVFNAGQIVEGTYKNIDGTNYTGGFSGWLYQGQGKLITKKSEYVGAFAYGFYEGKGRLSLSNGDVYDGDFLYGTYDGEGTLTLVNSIDGVKEKSGQWRDGRFIDPGLNNRASSPSLNNELALYNQLELLEKSFNKLEKNDPNEIELYFLGISGDGAQSVFRRETQYILDKFSSKFGTENKSISLINSRDTVKDVPLATTTSIGMAINSIETQMDLENDILFLYVTSHGSKSFDITLNQERLTLPNLSAETFSDLLNKSKIKWKVIVISACYSGGLISYLENDTSMIITSASPERKSFGCKETANFTYFGEAYFKQAIDKTESFVEAFDMAVLNIKAREDADGYTNSVPIIHKPKPIVEHLRKWRNSIREDNIF